MKKRKFIFFLIFLIFLCFFFFFYLKDKEIRELNKNLPQGVYFEKRGKDLFLINKLDGYELKIPESWGGVSKADYTGQNLGIGGKKEEKWVTITVYEVKKEKSIEEIINERIKNPEKYNLVEPQLIGKEKINNLTIIKIKDFGGMMGDVFFYYFKFKTNLYELYSDNQESLSEIIEFLEIL